MSSSDAAGSEETSLGVEARGPLATCIVFAACTALFVSGAATPWMWGWNAAHTDVTFLGLLRWSLLRDGVKETASGSMSGPYPNQWPALQAAAATLLLGAIFALAAAALAALQLRGSGGGGAPRSTVFPQLLLCACVGLAFGFAGTVIGCAEFDAIVRAYSYGPGFACSIAGTVLCGCGTFALLVGGARVGAAPPKPPALA